MSTSVPDIQFTTTGVVLPLESAILSGVQQDMNTAAGGTLSMTLTSPQGQLAQSSAAIIADKNNAIAEVVNQVDPDFASDRWQDAIGRIYFLTRIAASGTLVSALCTGLVNTVIPAGSIVQDSAGYQYASLGAVTIPASGSIVNTFQCLTAGPISVAVGALNTIYKQLTGWESVYNSTAGTPGTNVESRADFEFRRQNSVALNSVSPPQSVLAAVLNVPNVLDAYVIDNPTNAAVLTGPTNFSVAANSVYVAAAGGTVAAVAQAIYQKKTLGCSYNGSTTYTYTDQSSGVPPYPSYTIKYQIPASTPVYISVNLVNNPKLPSNIVALVQAAVQAAFTGADGGVRARIASTLYSGRYFVGVSGTDPNVQITSLYVGLAASPTTTTATLGIDQLPTLATANIVVTLA